MSASVTTLPPQAALFETLSCARKQNDWPSIIRLQDRLPEPLTEAWCEAADQIAFALGQAGQPRAAAALLKQCFELTPTQRLASALAYQFYDLLMDHKQPRKRRKLADSGPKQLAEDKQAFRQWIGEALRQEPASVKDLYRLGVFEAQLEQQHDRPALRAFDRALRAYGALPQGLREHRGDLAKVHAKALYAAGRSALRLHMEARARHYAFACIRFDRERDAVDPLDKLHLAGKVCLAQNQLDHAERAFRLALDDKSRRPRDHVFAALAETYRRRRDLVGAMAWITKHTRAHRRAPYLWRLLGRLQAEAGHPEEALVALESSLAHDRKGQHLTLVVMGELHLAAGRHGQARKAFERAIRFRRRHYQSEDKPALEGLARAAEQAGQAEHATELRLKLKALRDQTKDSSNRRGPAQDSHEGVG